MLQLILLNHVALNINVCVVDGTQRQVRFSRPGQAWLMADHQFSR